MAGGRSTPQRFTGIAPFLAHLSGLVCNRAARAGAGQTGGIACQPSSRTSGGTSTFCPGWSSSQTTSRRLGVSGPVSRPQYPGNPTPALLERASPLTQIWVVCPLCARQSGLPSPARRSFMHCGTSKPLVLIPDQNMRLLARVPVKYFTLVVQSSSLAPGGFDGKRCQRVGDFREAFTVRGARHLYERVSEGEVFGIFERHRG